MAPDVQKSGTHLLTSFLNLICSLIFVS